MGLMGHIIFVYVVISRKGQAVVFTTAFDGSLSVVTHLSYYAISQWYKIEL